MGTRGEIGADGLMRSERRRIGERLRVVKRAEARHRVRMAEPNPACRVYPGCGETDRPEDVEYNAACRAYEIDMWT